MGFNVSGLSVWWMASLLSVASLAAAADLRLVEAAKQGDKQAVRSLVKQRADVNAAEADGATALAWAVHRDDLETGELLLGAGARVNAANEYGVTPLSLACTNRSAAMVDRLLKAEANPNAAQQTGETLLMTCARTGNVDAVKSLLARGADVNAKGGRRGQTALMWAVSEKHLEIEGVLIERGADVNARSESGFTPLLFAARVGDLDSARTLLQAGANVNAATEFGVSPLLEASGSGHEALAIFLLEKGANPNAADGNGVTALHYAVQKGISILQTTTCGPNIAAYNAYRCRSNMLELVKALLAQGADPNARLVREPGRTGGGTGRSITGRVGATPLLLAATTVDVNIMRALLAAGADPSVGNFEDTTPLIVAAGMGRVSDRTPEEESSALEAVKLLVVEARVDVNQTDKNGQTPLHGAAYRGSDAIVQFLVDKGAKLDVVDRFGQSPLIIAEYLMTPEILKNRDRRPRILHKSTADLLLKLGATPPDPSAAQNPDAASVNAAGQ